MIPLTQQLECAQAVLATMRERNSRRADTMEAIVKTLERQELLRQVSEEIKGRETRGGFRYDTRPSFRIR